MWGGGFRLWQVLALAATASQSPCALYWVTAYHRGPGGQQAAASPLLGRTHIDLQLQMHAHIHAKRYKTSRTHSCTQTVSDSSQILQGGGGGVVKTRKDQHQ